MSRAAWAVAAASVLGFAACHNCLDDARVRISFEFARRQYEAGRFDEARKLYAKAVELCPDFYEGMLGLANACREYGNELFLAASELVAQKKTDQAQKMHQQAKDNHAQSMTLFLRLIELDPRDERPHYGLGLLFYQRATSPIPYPYGLKDPGRQKERDLAIREFEICVRKVPSSYQAHRYLSLCLFAAGRLEEGRKHLLVYHEFVQKAFDRIFMTWPSGSEEEKKRKEEALKNFEKEVQEVQEILTLYREDLDRRKRELSGRKDSLGPEERRELARVSRELLELEDALRGFSPAAFGGPVERELRQRCLEYLKCFNRGSLPECLSFATGKAEEAAALRGRLQDLIAQGTRYENLRFRSVSVAHDSGTVLVTGDVVTSAGTRPGVELRFDWRMDSGQWRIYGHP